MLAHLRDKRDVRDTAGVVYQIPCKDSEDLHGGDTENVQDSREGTQKGCELVRGGNVQQVQEERLVDRSTPISTHRPCGTNQPHYRLGQCQAFSMKENDWIT